MSPAENNLQPSTAAEKAFRDACATQLVDDVPTAISNLPHTGVKLSINSTGGLFPSKYRYTAFRDNDGGAQNHFQGCARLMAGPYLAIVGGDWREPASHLFVAKLESKGQKKRWGSNLSFGRPPASDRVIHRTILGTTVWHAGGIDTCGHLLAVPIECGGKAPGAKKPPKCKPAQSEVLFFDVRKPGAPQRLVTQILRSGIKATAVGLVHIPGVGYVAAVLGVDKHQTRPKDFQKKRIDFYQTPQNKIGSGFPLQPTYTYWVPKDQKFDSYQTMNFVREKGGDLFLIGMTGKIADLFCVSYPGAGWAPAKPSLRFFSRSEFKLDKAYAEFKAGVGVFVFNGKFNLYAVPQWRLGDGRLHMTEWAAP